MAQRTCRYCGVPIEGRQRTKCTALACFRAYNNERTARFNTQWKEEHGTRYGSRYNAHRIHVPGRLRQCESCGKDYRTKRQNGRVCSMACWCLISPQTTKASPLDWHQCETCERWLPRRRQRCPDVRRHALPAINRRWVMGSCIRCGNSFVAVDYTGQPRNLPRTCSLVCAKREAKSRRRAKKHKAFVEPVYRLRIFERDDWRCQLCGKKVRRTAKVPHPLAPVLDHIVPLARGGTHEPKNVQCAHYLCNSIKSDRGVDQLLLFG